MKEYSYIGKNEAGATERGSVYADSPREAARSLAKGGVIALKISEPGARYPKLGLSGLSVRSDRKFTMFFARQLASMMKSGLPVSEALRLISEDGSSSMPRVVRDIFREVQGGASLSNAMRKYPQIFSGEAVSLVEAGELSGSLDRLMNDLAGYLESEYAAREKLITIMLYPAMLFITVSAVLAFILRFILPSFASLFMNINTPLPLPTRIVMAIGVLFDEYWPLIAGAVCMMSVLWRALYSSEKYRIIIDGWAFKAPVFGKLMLYTELMKFSGTLSILLSSGIVSDQALEIVTGCTGNAYMKSVLLRVHSDVQKGMPLSTSMKRHRIFPASLTGLIATGEFTGDTDEMLGRVASFCRAEADNLSERIRALIAPAALLILGGIVGLVIFSIALPVLDNMTAIME